MICELLLHIFLGTPQERQALKAKWHTFKEKHIISDDPYEKAEYELYLKLKREAEEAAKGEDRETAHSDF